MESVVKLLCCKGLEVSKICYSPDCQHDAILMCKKQDCECQKPHEKCLMIVTLQSLKLRMQQKGKLVEPVYECLVKWYEAQTKLFTMKLADIKRVMGNYKLVLGKNEVDFDNLITEGKSSQITSQLVDYVVKSLMRKTINVESKINSVKKELENQTKQINRILLQMEKFQDPFDFQKQSKVEILQTQFRDVHKKLEVLNDKKIIRKIPPNPHKVLPFGLHPALQSSLTALLQPSVEVYGNKKQLYKYKVMKTGSNIMFGMMFGIQFGFCHLNECIKENHQNNYGEGKGGYVVNCNGNIYTHSYQQIKRGYDKITFIRDNDIIHVLYNPREEIVKFRNITKNTEDIIQMKKQIGNPLYPCIMLYDENDEVEFLGMEIVEQ